MATTRILIVQKVETELEVEYESADDLEKQIEWAESQAETHIHNDAEIMYSEILIKADTPRR